MIITRKKAAVIAGAAAATVFKELGGTGIWCQFEPGIKVAQLAEFLDGDASMSIDVLYRSVVREAAGGVECEPERVQIALEVFRAAYLALVRSIACEAQPAAAVLALPDFGVTRRVGGKRIPGLATRVVLRRP